MNTDTVKSCGSVIECGQLRQMRTPKLIVPGAVIEWEEDLCRHRGTYRKRRIVVAQITGNNIEDIHGSWYYWTDMKRFTALKATLPAKPLEQAP